MKRFRYLKYIFLLFAAPLFNACNYLDREPDADLTIDMIFADKIRTEDWLAGVYSGIPDPYSNLLNTIGYDAMGDDMAPSPRWVQWDFPVINQQQGNWGVLTAWESGFWDGLPKRIRQARIFIENVKVNHDQDLTEEYVEDMKNEARFLIAYYYWELLYAYGAIPFYDGIVPTTASLEELLIGQVPFDTMIDILDKELLELSKVLPPTYTQSIDGREASLFKFGRATSIMCLAVRSRMLLFAASPLVNGNPDYANHKNIHGDLIFNPVEDSGKWVKAKEACEDLLNAAHAIGHGLYKEYNKGGVIDPFMSYQNMLFKKETEGNTEILFARPDCDVRFYDGHAAPRGADGNGGLGVTQSLVDAFFMNNGLPAILGYDDNRKPLINDASGYTETGFSTADEKNNFTTWNEANGEGIVTKRGTYNMYCGREPRFYVSVLFNEAYYRPEKRTVNFFSNQIDGGPTHDAPQSGYLVKKKVHPEHHIKNKIYPYRPGILYRLGEAYLNYAEILNHTDPGNPDILRYVNMIRERAGIPAYGSAAGEVAPPQTTEDVFEAIYRERRVELNCESGLRYFDLRRWKKAEKELNRDFYGMNFSGSKRSNNEEDPNAYYVRKIYQKRIFLKRNYWYPIYQDEIDKDPSLVQAPFWTE